MVFFECVDQGRYALNSSRELLQINLVGNVGHYPRSALPHFSVAWAASRIQYRQQLLEYVA
jgi:hypothetical protein